MPSDPNQPLVNFCYTHLRDAIIRGELAPGEKLKIAALTARLKVGPTPIREALSRLCSSGLVIAADNKGFRVQTVTEAEVEDIYETFESIENLALGLAIERGDARWEAGIVSALHLLKAVEQQKNIHNYQGWFQANHQFHLSLILGCNSPCLLKIREQLYLQFDRFCHLSFLLNKEPLEENFREHQQLADAAVARNREKACRLMTQHLEKSKRSVTLSLKKKQQ